MKKILALLSIICVLSFEMWAIPARPGIITLVQLDGTEMQVRLVSDENHHYYVTLDGEIISQQSTVNSQQSAVATELGIRKRVHPSTFTPNFSLLTSHSQRAPHHAERGLVILVEFSDVSFTYNRQNFDDLLNKDGYDYNGAIGSAMNYFKDASNGSYVPHFDVFGPYKLDREVSYYGENDKEGLDKHPDQMVVDAVAKLASDMGDAINFADYDTDNNGYIDNIFIYYAGHGENEGAPDYKIWPHAWSVYSEYVEGQLIYNEKKLRGYACTSELQRSSGTIMCGVGTICHEFSHVLGLPDWYVTDYSSSHKTLGKWDLMDAGSYLNNGNHPPTFSAHERFYLGWLTPEILNEEGEYELEELQKSNKAYIITETGAHNLNGGNPNPKTYFLLENRQKNGWDAYLPGPGLMISKTVYNESDWENNTPNNNKNKQGYDIIEADGKAPNDHLGKAGDLFPGSANVTSYTPFAAYSISDIAERNGIISFSFMKNLPTDGNGDCFVESFDRLIAESSVDITEDIDKYADNAGWSGHKLFCGAGLVKVGSSSEAGYIITPQLPFEGTIEVEFVGRGYSADATINFEIDGEVVHSFDVTARNTTEQFKLEGFVANTTIKIYANTNRFYIDNLKICKPKPTAMDEVGRTEVAILTMDGDRAELIGVVEGAEVYCYDALGRLMWHEVGNGEAMSFVKPQSFYLIRIVDNNNEYILKGL